MGQGEGELKFLKGLWGVVLKEKNLK